MAPHWAAALHIATAACGRSPGAGLTRRLVTVPLVPQDELAQHDGAARLWAKGRLLGLLELRGALAAHSGVAGVLRRHLEVQALVAPQVRALLELGCRLDASQHMELLWRLLVGLHALVAPHDSWSGAIFVGNQQCYIAQQQQLLGPPVAMGRLPGSYERVKA
jgi:hypothetical protein